MSKNLNSVYIPAKEIKKSTVEMQQKNIHNGKTNKFEATLTFKRWKSDLK